MCVCEGEFCDGFMIWTCGLDAILYQFKNSRLDRWYSAQSGHIAFIKGVQVKPGPDGISYE